MDPFTINEDSNTYTSTRAVSPEEIIAAAKDILAARVIRSVVLSSPDTVRDYLVTTLSETEYEVFACLFLDQRHRLIEFRQLFAGTIDGCTVHPREVVKTALQLNAAAVILAHNHPSGVAEPSEADKRITQRLKDGLALVDIRMLDHIVIGGIETVSFAERGLL